MKKDIAVIAVLILIILAGAILFQSYSGGKDALSGLRDMGRDEGVVTLAFGESAKFGDLTLEPMEVIEDSRCAQDVVCIWAGTVRLKLRIASGLGTAVQPIELGKSITTEAEEIKLVSVSPLRTESEPTARKDYRFTFEVKRRVAESPNQNATSTNTGTVGKCYVGGCSSQICSDKPDAVSTCEFRAEYSCYKTAKCERQASGQCGWTPTRELQMCLQNPPSL